MTDRTMDRRSFLERATAAGALAALRPARAPAPPPAPRTPRAPRAPLRARRGDHRRAPGWDGGWEVQRPRAGGGLPRADRGARPAGPEPPRAARRARGEPR